MPKKATHRPFIVIEALDAGGSQTQTDRLVARLKKEGYAPHQYHFPQEDTPTGRIVYDKFLLHKTDHPMSRREQALLYIQDFYTKSDEIYQYMHNGKQRDIIVSDRFCTSTLAYQTIGLSGKQRQHMVNWIEWLCWKGKPRLPKPTRVILLDTAVDTSLKHLRGKKKDFFENKKKLAAARASYLRCAREYGWHVVSGMDREGRQRSIGDIHNDVWEIVQKVV